MKCIHGDLVTGVCPQCYPVFEPPTPVTAEPDAWLYECPPDDLISTKVFLSLERSATFGPDWKETPLYIHPPTRGGGAIPADVEALCQSMETNDHDWEFLEVAAMLRQQAQKIAELQENEMAYERILGPKSYQQVADEIAGLRAKVQVQYDELVAGEASDKLLAKRSHIT